jgi:glycosyltransferase involved in cell wall biosynthesis
MRRTRVLYYVHTYFLDSCLETLQSIKHDVDIDLLIEVSPDSLKSTVFELSDINSYNRIENLQHILDASVWRYFQTYFQKIKSVEVIFFKGKGMLSADSILGGLFLGRLVRLRKYDVIHFDTASGRALSSLLLIQHKSLILTIHDPITHVGEESFLLDMVRFLYKRHAKSIFFYSHFSRSLFAGNKNHQKHKLYLLRLQPYSFIAQFKKAAVTSPSYILFFGQLSFYKGIDLLLEAIPKVLEAYPHEHFVVAGKSNGFNLNREIFNLYPNNISFIDEYFSIEQLSDLINSSKFIVCPYREATQSGVLMTTFAMGKSALVTDVGAFPEYISNGINGLLANAEPNSIANGIISMLASDHYLQLEKNIVSGHSKADAIQNKHSLMNAYQSVNIQ